MIDFILNGGLYFSQFDAGTQVNDQMTVKLKKLRKELLEIQALPKEGIRVTPAFVAHSKTNSPLDFQCSLVIHNKTIDMTIDKVNFIAKLGNCSTEYEKQIMTWRKTYHLKTNDNLSVWATERNVLTRDAKISGHITITPNDLLDIYRFGFKFFAIRGTEYSILFHKKQSK